MKNYNILIRFLHRITLGNKFVPELLFDLENLLNKNAHKKTQIKHQVYVGGLARAGTTILMRTIYSTKRFASYTYRDMPFLISPNIWNFISKRFKSNEPMQRNHNDNILINLDSPEQFEEIFWKLKNERKYIEKEFLKNYTVDDYSLELYENFIKNCIIKYNKNSYLSKNNNSILRIDSIIKKFPNSLFLVLFRSPLDHAISLFKTHINFSKLQVKNKFMINYMDYLAHYEFGLNHKYMNFPERIITKYNNNQLNFWLSEWINFYTYTLDKKLKENKNVILINYEDLCTKQDEIVNHISNFLKDEIFKDMKSKYFHFKTYNVKDYDFDEELVDKATKIFDQLKK